jgi:hypothetical protein
MTFPAGLAAIPAGMVVTAGPAQARRLSVNLR